MVTLNKNKTKLATIFSLVVRNLFLIRPFLGKIVCMLCLFTLFLILPFLLKCVYILRRFYTFFFSSFSCEKRVYPVVFLLFSFLHFLVKRLCIFCSFLVKRVCIFCLFYSFSFLHFLVKRWCILFLNLNKLSIRQLFNNTG